MSYTEINSRNWGMPYGGMPDDRLLEKLEETDPDLISEVRGYDELHELESEYPDYVRAEIIDWAPDTPFLESDHPRRDPAWSRSVLNLRYNGTRGSNPELPRHPELFYGFTGNDPRGADNTPRFDEWRGHITSRAAELCVSMGDNDDHALAERPWSGQAISYDMKELHRRLKRNTKIFTVQKEGRPWGNNVVADEFAAGPVRAAGMGAGGETFAAAGEGFYGAAPPRFAAGDHGLAAELFTDGVRGEGVPEGNGTPWRHTVGEADLGVQQYGQKRGAGRAQVGPGAAGGGLARAGGADQAWDDSRRAQGTNRRALGATMALAARYRRGLKSGAHDQAPVPGAGYEAPGAPAGGLAPARDIALLYRHTVEDQTRRPGAEVQDGEGGQLGGARGLAPAAHPERAARAAEASAAPNAHLTNAEAIVAGLREGTAAARRRVASLVVPDGARHLAVAEAAGGARRGAAPGDDYGRLARLTSAPLARSAAAGLEVRAYRGAPPSRPEQRAALARGAYEGGTWRPHLEALPLGASRAPGEWRSASQGQSRLGDAPDQVFGPDADVAGYHGAAPMGPKTLRAGSWSDSAGLTDEMGDFGDGVGVGA